MNKTMEYMAFDLPVVAFDLRETKASAAEAGVYAAPNQVDELARIVIDLIDDEPRRHSWVRRGGRGVEPELAWSHQAPRYLSAVRPSSGSQVRTPAGHCQPSLAYRSPRPAERPAPADNR